STLPASDVSAPLGIRIATGGMCSKESGMESNRTFIRPVLSSMRSRRRGLTKPDRSEWSQLYRSAAEMPTRSQKGAVSGNLSGCGMTEPLATGCNFRLSFQQKSALYRCQVRANGDQSLGAAWPSSFCKHPTEATSPYAFN